MLEAKRIFMYSTIKKIIFVLYIAITPLMAQQNNPILGTWEGIPIIQNDDSSSNQKRQISFIMFGEDGYYFQASFPTDRPVPRTVIDKRSREDLLSQFKDLITRVGTYRVFENTLVQTIQSSSDMIEEGGEIVITFRIDGDRLLFFNHLSGDKPISIYKKINQKKDEPVDPEKIKWLKSNHIVLRSINPDDTNFSDFEPIKKAIGNAQIVMLGEQSHGDGATFDAKIRLIRFLHEKMGFNVLSWESGMYDCEIANGMLKNGNIDTALESSIFGIWAQGRTLPPLFKYISSTHTVNKPLLMTGFDIQFTGNKFDKNRYLSEFLDGLPNDIKNKINDELKKTILDLVEHLKNKEYANYSKEIRSSKEEEISNLIKTIEKYNKPKNKLQIDYSLRLLKNLYNLAKMWSDEIDKNVDEGFRDRCMADNLLWLIQHRYPGEKIIVWAASMHIARNITTIDTEIPGISYNDSNTMGQGVWNVLKDKMYSIAFTAYDGYFGTPFSLHRPLSPAIPNSLEGIFKSTNANFSFIDFKSIPDGHWLRRKLKARPLGHATMTSEWPLNFDAMFFIKTMYNNPKIEK